MTQVNPATACSTDAAAAWDPDLSAHLPACLQVARLLLRDEQMAEDAVQEACLSAWQHRARFDPARATERSWLLLLTHRRAVDRIRREQRQRDESVATNERELRDEAARTSVADPATILVRDERAEAVRNALRQLPIPQREVLILAHWGGYTQREIAHLMSCPLGTVKTRCLAGMRQLRTALEAVPS